MTRLLRRLGIGPRLFVAFVAVSGLGVLAGVSAAALVGSSFFTTHLDMAGVSEHESAALHAREAFDDAFAYAASASVIVALVSSAILSALVARSASRSMASFAHAARAASAGTAVSVAGSPGLGPEFDQLAQALNAMNLQLHDAEQRRESLLQDIAHEIRTPVTNLLATVEAVVDGVVALDEATLSRLRKQGERLTRLTEDLAQASSVALVGQGPALVEVSVSDLVSRTVTSFSQRAADAGVSLSGTVAHDVPPVEVDRDRIGQVLDNLVLNAISHTPAGGNVALRALLEGQRVRLEVLDDGRGIAPEHLDRIFERFYRVEEARDRSTGGSGLGLAISRQIVEAHHGSIAAYSDGPGCGTTVVIHLPLA